MIAGRLITITIATADQSDAVRFITTDKVTPLTGTPRIHIM